MKDILAIYLRGVFIVFFTSLNVGQIAGKHYGGAFIGGFMISFLWWGNAFKANHHDVRFAAYIYGLGAATGTLLGILATDLLY